MSWFFPGKNRGDVTVTQFKVCSWQLTITCEHQCEQINTVTESQICASELPRNQGEKGNEQVALHSLGHGFVGVLACIVYVYLHVCVYALTYVYMCVCIYVDLYL